LIIGLPAFLIIIYSGIKLNKDFEQLKDSEIETKSLLDEISISKDIIEDNLYEKNVLLEKLEIALNIRHKFFSIIAHDLRSPFTSLLGFSNYFVEDFEILAENEKKETAKIINDSINKLFDLINNLLIWAKSQFDNNNFNPQEVTLHNTIETVFNALNISAFKKKINLELNCTDDITVLADPNMLETIIRNLVSNAIKFTNENGAINVRVSDKNDFILIEVIDNGIGMSDYVAQNIFQLDKNVSRKGTSNESGTGLGLAICKEFIKIHGGNISVKSEVGKGTNISFTLPK